MINQSNSSGIALRGVLSQFDRLQGEACYSWQMWEGVSW